MPDFPEPIGDTLKKITKNLKVSDSTRKGLRRRIFDAWLEEEVHPLGQTNTSSFLSTCLGSFGQAAKEIWFFESIFLKLFLWQFTRLR